MQRNYPAPPLKSAQTYGPQWVGVPQHALRLATLAANLKQGTFGR